MTTFDKREEGFEAKFAHDEEVHFMALARRNKQLAAWAASLMGLAEPDATTYGDSLLAAEYLGQTDDQLVLRVISDLKAKTIVRSPQEIVAMLRELLEKAIADIKAGR